MKKDPNCVTFVWETNHSSLVFLPCLSLSLLGSLSDLRAVFLFVTGEGLPLAILYRTKCLVAFEFCSGVR